MGKTCKEAVGFEAAQLLGHRWCWAMSVRKETVGRKAAKLLGGRFGDTLG
jgi:hypothetical protein